MSTSQSGFPDVPKSITNPNVETTFALDSGEPLSFLEFIKIVSVTFDSEKIQEYYNNYLKAWNNKVNSKDSDTQAIIVERYRQFIRDVNLTFTTNEEKVFLTQLDFNDPLDLEVAIPFYTKKLIEITDYYNRKREEVKFQINRNKLKGTNFGFKKDVVDVTLDYLENLESGQILYNFGDLRGDIEVEIEELYDNYPNYFNQKPNENVYDKKDIDYGLDIFLKDNEDIIEDVFSDISDDLRVLKEFSVLFDNKRKLTENTITNDFYYLSTGSTVYDFVSGKAFDSTKPAANFINNRYPTTASTDQKQLISPYSLGFFRPQKTSIILVDGENSTYSFNFENLEPNKIYYFPDPAIQGQNGDVLTFTSIDTNLKRGDSSGKAKNQPTSSQTDSKYYGYISQTEITPSKYLDKIFDSGYIQDSKSDVFGNLYGLFKNDGDFTKTITQQAETTQLYQILNGHTFYDRLYSEAYSFDYSTFDDTTYEFTTRSGLSAYTQGFATDFSRYNLIYGGTFNNNEFYYYDGYEPSYQILDGAFILNGNTPYVDTVSSDLSSFELSGTHYFTRLIEGGINEDSPLQRALLDSSYPTLTADATQTIITDEISAFSIDGGEINGLFIDYTGDKTNTHYDPTVLETSNYILSSDETKNYFDRLDINGSIYIRNSYNKNVDRLEEVFDYFSSTFPLSVYTELISAVESFEIVDDVMFIQTENNLTISKISYADGVFSDPKTQVFTTEFNQNPFNKISERYKIGNSVYYATLNIVEYPLPVLTNDFVIYPIIYEIDLDSYKQKTYIPNINEGDYTVYGEDRTYIKADNPTFTYSKRNGLCNVSFLVKDASNMFSLNEYDFELGPFNMLSHAQFRQD